MDFDKPPQWVAYTRHVTCTGRIIQHAWGPPQPTKAKARTILNKVMRESMLQDPDKARKVERYVIRLHG